MKQIKVNVFGQLYLLKQVKQQWQLFAYSETGINRRIYDVVLPDDLAESELLSYLADIFHEYASERHPDVYQL